MQTNTSNFGEIGGPQQHSHPGYTTVHTSMHQQPQPHSNEPSDEFWLALMALADNFYTQSPPNIKLCAHCLLCITVSNPPPKIEARTHLQLGSLFLKETIHLDRAESHLEKAMTLSSKINGYTDCYFEAGSLLAKVYVFQKKTQDAVTLLQTVYRDAQNSSYWNSRILFQLAQVAMDEGNLNAATHYLQTGEAECSNRFGASYARILFKLGHGMLLLIQREFVGVDAVLGASSQLINCYNDSPKNKEMCKILFLIMQTCHFLYASQVFDFRKIKVN